MPRNAAKLDQLFDRTWRPGHPFCPRLSSFRRWGNLLILALLSSVIILYAYLTNSNRVQIMCESYLSQLVGGRVLVKHASLSIFEGLRLDGVQVYVDDRGGADSHIFDAESFLLKYNPESILSGKLEATEILAIQPHVWLCEDLDQSSGHRWNWSRMNPSARKPGHGGPGGGALPVILLRHGIIEYSQMQHGRMTAVGSMALDGGLTPGDVPGSYLCRLQSTGEESELLGPVISATFLLKSGGVRDGRLENFRFSSDVLRMLPEQVRQWCDAHGLTGRLDITGLDGTTGKNGAKPQFHFEARLGNVDMDIPPSEWMSRPETERLAVLHGALDLMQAAGVNAQVPTAGFGQQENATETHPAAPPDNAPATAAGGAMAGTTVGFTQWLRGLAEPAAIRLGKVTGQLIFTQDGIGVHNLNGRIEDNAFIINGHIDGYSPSATADITMLGTQIFIPHTPRYVNALPRPVHEFWEHLHPEGAATLRVHLNRGTPGAKPSVEGGLDILDGHFVCDLFPYPLQKVTGAITFGPDPAGGERCDIRNLSGISIYEDGVNASKPVTVNGFVAPLTSDGEVVVQVEAHDVVLDASLNAALPKEVRQAMRMFDTGGTRGFPEAHGAFSATVHRPPGPWQPFGFHVTVDIDDASGCFELFPYPLDHLAGKLEIGLHSVDIINAHATLGDQSLRIDGKVKFGDNEPLDPDLTIVARNLPVDKKLLNALSADKRGWLEKLGVSGTLDVDGRVKLATTQSPQAGEEHTRVAADSPPNSVPGSPTSSPTTNPTAPISINLKMSLRDGTLTPPGTLFTLTHVSGKLDLGDDHLTLTHFKARRGNADLSGGGVIGWLDNRPSLVMSGSAHDLQFDQPLYTILPADARAAWDQVQPEGTVDADLTYNGSITPSDADAPADPPAGATADPAASAPAATGPLPAAAPPADFQLKLRSRKTAITFKPLPYTLTDLQGSVTIVPGKVTIENISGHHGDAAIGLAGTGVLGGPATRPVWNVHLVGKDVRLSKEFKSALPASLSSLLDTLKATGDVTFDLPKLVYTGAKDEPPVQATLVNGHRPPAVAPPASQASPFSPDADLDVAGNIWLVHSNLNVGVPLTDMNGVLSIDTHVRNGKLGEFKGEFNIDSLSIADRPATRMVASLYKPADQDALKIERIGCQMLGGELGGQVDMAFPDEGASRFALALALRGVDVKELARLNDNAVKGQLNASLSLEGDWGVPSSRRGRGDVEVTGKEMYKIPLVLGLMQITNLSLPISSPFNQGTARYSVDGPQVTFENIELRASNMVMSGSGSLNFETRKVQMTFATDNPAWTQLPLVGGLLQGAKNDFFQIHVNGTVQDPKVSAGMMNTFTTTVDQVLKGNNQRGNGK